MSTRIPLRFVILPVFALGLATLACKKAEEAAPPGETAAPVAAVPTAAAAGGAHSDHSPKHGGVFFMAANNFHHLEGTYPEAGLFRLYLYDDRTRPISVVGSSGHVRLANEAETTQHELVPEADGMTLGVKLDPTPALPVHLVLTLNLTNPATGAAADHRFEFHFKSIGEAHQAPGEGHSHASPHGGQVVSVGEDLHFELGVMGETFALWVLDSKLLTLPLTSMEASLILQRKDGTTENVPLSAMGEHFMAVSPIENSGGATVLAQENIEGRARIARFSLPAAP